MQHRSGGTAGIIRGWHGELLPGFRSYPYQTRTVFRPLGFGPEYLLVAADCQVEFLALARARK
jgi:hypothetical protein